MRNAFYTTQLQAGTGLVDDTLILLDLWQPGMDVTQLKYSALESGRFPNVTFRRLRNIVVECFKPRYLVEKDAPALLLKSAKNVLQRRELMQLMFIFTCRANTILYDFVREIYWSVYSSGRDQISNDDAISFVTRANQDGKTQKTWSEGTIIRVARYLTGTCADFGLLEGGERSTRKILPFRLENRVAAILAYELHFSGQGDNRVLSHTDWSLFGMERDDVFDEIKRLALKDWLIVQSAGDVIRIAWQYPTMEELIDVIARE